MIVIYHKENSVAVFWTMTFEGFSIWSHVEHIQTDDLVHNTRTDLGQYLELHCIIQGIL